MTTEARQLATATSDIRVWRVGYRPDPWAWPSWQYATNGRFPGRWDDAEGNFRTIYAGSHLLSCLLEVLACFRPDPDLAAQLSDIIDDETRPPRTPPARPAPSLPPGCNPAPPPPPYSPAPTRPSPTPSQSPSSGRSSCTAPTNSDSSISTPPPSRTRSLGS